MKCIGIDRASGEFTADDGKEINYDNFYVYMASTAKDKRRGNEHYGQSTKEYKIKATDFFESFPGIDSPADVIGLEFVPYYNEYQKIIGFILMNQKCERG